MKKAQIPQYHPQVVPATADDGMEDAAFSVPYSHFLRTRPLFFKL